jgi:hypothetical protein
MTQYSEAGKGSQQRPTDYEKFAAQYDKIFGTKKHRVAKVLADYDTTKKPANLGDLKQSK